MVLKRFVVSIFRYILILSYLISSNAFLWKDINRLGISIIHSLSLTVINSFPALDYIHDLRKITPSKHKREFIDEPYFLN